MSCNTILYFQKDLEQTLASVVKKNAVTQTLLESLEGMCSVTKVDKASYCFVCLSVIHDVQYCYSSSNIVGLVQ